MNDAKDDKPETARGRTEDTENTGKNAGSKAAGQPAGADPGRGDDAPAADRDVFVEKTAKEAAEKTVEESTDTPAGTPGDETAAVSATPPVAPARRGAMTWLSLAAAVFALLAAGFVYIAGEGASSDVEANRASITALHQRVAELAGAAESADASAGESSREAARVREALDEALDGFDRRLQRLEGVEDRMSNLENSVASLQGISAGTRDTWLLAEAEYYMQIANAQLKLAGNPTLATLALGMADERIVQTGNPALTEVRAAIADELAALELMDKPDIEGITLTLASLARVVESLPLKTLGSGAAEGADAELDPELTGVARAWASVKGAMSGLIRVTPPDETHSPLLTPDAEALLRSNLALQLQAARLALLRGQRAQFEQSLDDAIAWLGLYFDTDSGQVTGARETIDEIRGALFAGETPDISESLRLLRQFRSLSAGSGQ